MIKRRLNLLVLCVCLCCAAPALSEHVTATLQFGGDLLIHDTLLADAYDEATDTYDFTHMLAPVAPLLAETDLTVLNLEVPISGTRYSGYPQFNSPPALLDAIAATGADLLLCANNHALDRLGKGARNTIEAIEAAGLRHIGTARNKDEYNAVPLFDLNGIQVAIFNYTQHTNGMEKEDTEANLRHAVHYFAVHRAERDVQVAREAGADFVILCTHWGKEYEREPTKTVRNWAKELEGIGVDLVIGGHPHVLQGYETINDMLVLYSTGNFLSGQREQYRDTGALFRFTLEKDMASGETSLQAYGYIPTWVWESDGSFRVVAIEEALASPDPGMTIADIARMQEALAETTSLLGVEQLISQSSPTPAPTNQWFVPTGGSS